LQEAATDLNDTKAASLYRLTQEELINIQNMFKKGELSIQEVESKFEAWKMRPEVILASSSHRTEVEAMKHDWEKVRKALKTRNDEGLLKRIKNRHKNGGGGKMKSSLTDLKFATLPSMPLRLRKPSSSKSTSSLLKDQQRAKSLSESSTSSNLDSDSSWSAETTASNVDKYLASEVKDEVPSKPSLSSKIHYDNVTIENGEVRLSSTD